MASPIDYVVRAPEAGVDILCVQFAVGASGAVGAIQGTGSSRMKELRRITTANPSPVVYVSAGTYDLFLREPWIALLDMHGLAIGAVAAASGTAAKLVTNSVAVATAPKVRVTFVRLDTGVAAEITNGDIASVTLTLKKWRPL